MSQFILLLKNVLHVSDGLSVHHQELKTVYIQQQVYVKQMMPDDGRKCRPKHVECFSKIKHIATLGHLMYIGPCIIVIVEE